MFEAMTINEYVGLLLKISIFMPRTIILCLIKNRSLVVLHTNFCIAFIGFEFFAHVDAQPVDAAIASNSLHVVGLEVQVLPHPVSKPTQHSSTVVPVALAPLFLMWSADVQSTFSASTVLPAHMPVTVEGIAGGFFASHSF